MSKRTQLDPEIHDPIVPEPEPLPPAIDPIAIGSPQEASPAGAVPPEPSGNLKKYPSALDVDIPGFDGHQQEHEEIGILAYELNARRLTHDGGLPRPPWSGLTEAVKQSWRYTGAGLKIALKS